MLSICLFYEIQTATMFVNILENEQYIFEYHETETKVRY